MNMIRWVLAAPLLLIGAWMILYHWRLVVLFVRVRFFGCHHKWESSVPLAGPLSIFLGLSVAPAPDLLRYSWASLAFDPVTYVLIYGLPILFRDLVLSKKENP